MWQPKKKEEKITFQIYTHNISYFFIFFCFFFFVNCFLNKYRNQKESNDENLCICIDNVYSFLSATFASASTSFEYHPVASFRRHFLLFVRSFNRMMKKVKRKKEKTPKNKSTNQMPQVEAKENFPSYSFNSIPSIL